MNKLLEKEDISINNKTIISYLNITDAVYDFANNIKDDFQTSINIKKSKMFDKIDYSTQLQTIIFNKAKEMFSKNGNRVFKNNNDYIYVSNSDIKESIAKTVRNSEQKKLIVEHLEVFSNLGKIIEKGIKINFAPEIKDRFQFKKWDYYATPISIDNKKYIVEFDTVLRNNNEKHFRLQRIYNLEKFLKKQNTLTGKIETQSVNRLKEYPVSTNNNSINT